MVFKSMIDERARVSDDPKPVRTAEVFAVLRQRILQWEYPPGYRFTEEELCKEFGVSRSPVRETLRMLEENGLVDKVPYRGTTVKQPDMDEIGEIYDVRMILESAIVEQLAAQGLPAEVASQLYEHWEQMARTPMHATVDAVELAQQDRTFHETLAHATGNRTLAAMLEAINDRLQFIRMTDITTIDRLWETCQQHLVILNHITAGNVAAASAAMHDNISGARGHVRAAFKEALARAYFERSMR